MSKIVHSCSGLISWEALSWALSISFTTYQRLRAEQYVELLWSGPSPANQIPARRIDQALYDLIASATSGDVGLRGEGSTPVPLPPPLIQLTRFLHE
jgi:hypothetical protein